MFHLNTFLSLLLLLLTTSPLWSQDEPLSSYDFGEPSAWTLLEKNSKLFYYYTKSEDLIAFDYLNHAILWRTHIPGIKSNEAGLITQFPYIWFNDVKSNKKGLIKSRRLLLSQVDGSIALDSDQIPFNDIDQYRVLFDRGVALIVGKQDKKKLLALYPLGEDQLKWSIEPPNPAKGLFQTHEVDDRIAVNQDHIVLKYNGLLLALSLTDGQVAWSRPINDGTFQNFFQRPVFDRLADPNIYVIEINNNAYTLMASQMKDGQPVWSEHCVLGDSYSLTSRKEHIFLKTAHQINLIDYQNGYFLLPAPLPLPEEIVDLHRHADGYSAWMVKPRINNDPAIAAATKTEATHMWGFRWITSDLSSATWANMATVEGSKLIAVRQIQDKLWYQTDRATGFIDIYSGRPLGTFQDLAPDALIVQDTFLPGIVVFQNNTLYSLNRDNGTKRILKEDVQLENKKDTIREVRAMAEGLALLGDRSMISFDRQGNLAHAKTYKQPADLGKIGATLLSLTAGVLFKDEMKELNRALYQADLIDGGDASRNALAMYQFGALGSGAVAQSFANRFIKQNNSTQHSSVFTRLNRLWIVTDKLENRRHGLRLVDAFTGREIKHLSLSEKAHYDYQLDLSLETLLMLNGNKLCIYKLTY